MDNDRLDLIKSRLAMLESMQSLRNNPPTPNPPGIVSIQPTFTQSLDVTIEDIRYLLHYVAYCDSMLLAVKKELTRHTKVLEQPTQRGQYWYWANNRWWIGQVEGKDDPSAFEVEEYAGDGDFEWNDCREVSDKWVFIPEPDNPPSS